MRHLAACVVALVAAGCQRGEVVRIAGGEEHAGPFVYPETYAAYARGAVAESEGRLHSAAAAYARALGGTDDALVHARLGAVLCRMGRGAEAEAQFARGNHADPRAAVVFRERARCALAAKAWRDALDASKAAFELDPSDPETLAIRAEALERAGRSGDADAIEAEANARRGEARPLAEAAPIQTGMAAALGAPRGRLADVDEALARGAVDEASARASRVRMSRTDFAARALAYGHVAYAVEVARRVAAADPKDTSARLVAAAGADLAQDEDALARALGDVQAAPPSDLARLLFAELLARREGPAAAAAFVPVGLLRQPREDVAEEMVRLRLVAVLAPEPGGRSP